MNNKVTLYHKIYCSRSKDIYEFGRPFLCHYNYIPSLSSPCLGLEKKIFKEIVNIHYETYMATPIKNKTLPKG